MSKQHSKLQKIITTPLLVMLFAVMTMIGVSSTALAQDCVLDLTPNKSGPTTLFGGDLVTTGATIDLTALQGDFAGGFVEMPSVFQVVTTADTLDLPSSTGDITVGNGCVNNLGVKVSVTSITNGGAGSTDFSIVFNSPVIFDELTDSCVLSWPVTIPAGASAGLIGTSVGVGSAAVNPPNLITNCVTSGDARIPNTEAEPVTYNVNECAVEVDKRVSCDGGVTFVDLGFDDGVQEACDGWNAGDLTPAEDIIVEYYAENQGSVNFTSCTLGESNAGFTNVALVDENVLDVRVCSISGNSCFINSDCVENGEVCQSQSSSVIKISNASNTCSDSLASGEPDTATLECTCRPANGAPAVTTTSTDLADFQCLTPDLQVGKVCDPQDAQGNNAVTITLDAENSDGVASTAALANCVVTDALTGGGPYDGVCSGGADATDGQLCIMAASSCTGDCDPIDVAAGGTVVLGTVVNGLGEDMLNTASVECQVVGSLDISTCTLDCRTAEGADDPTGADGCDGVETEEFGDPCGAEGSTCQVPDSGTCLPKTITNSDEDTCAVPVCEVELNKCIVVDINGDGTFDETCFTDDGICSAGTIGDGCAENLDCDVAFVAGTCVDKECTTGKVGEACPGDANSECDIIAAAGTCIPAGDGDAIAAAFGLSNPEKAIKTFYRADNPGDVDLESCVISDSFPDLTAEPFGDGEILASESKMHMVAGVCSADQLNKQGTLTCDCAGLATQAIDTASASLECLTCAVEIDKQVSCDGLPFEDVTGSDPDGAKECNAAGTEPEGTPCVFNSDCGTGGTCVDGRTNNTCTTWDGESELDIKYIVRNVGDVDLTSCLINDTSPLDPSNPGGDIVVGGMFMPTDPELLDLDCGILNPKSSAGIADCLCATTIDGSPVRPGAGLPDLFGPVRGPEAELCNVMDDDSAGVECQTADLMIRKVCDDQEILTADCTGDECLVNAVSIELENTGQADLEDCVVTDDLIDGSPFTGACNGAPDAGKLCNVDGDCDSNDCAPIDIAGTTMVTVTGDVLGLDITTENEASVVCDVVGSVADVSTCQFICETAGDEIDRLNACSGATAPGDDCGAPIGSGVCEIASLDSCTRKTVEPDPATNDCVVEEEGCFTRTPGYWKNHPKVSQFVIDSTPGQCSHSPGQTCTTVTVADDCGNIPDSGDCDIVSAACTSDGDCPDTTADNNGTCSESGVPCTIDDTCGPSTTPVINSGFCTETDAPCTVNDDCPDVGVCTDDQTTPCTVTSANTDCSALTDKTCDVDPATGQTCVDVSFEPQTCDPQGQTCADGTLQTCEGEGELVSCGVTMDTADSDDTGVQGSITEDLCGIGSEKKNFNGGLDATPQQVQIARQCAAANLNWQASQGVFGVFCGDALEASGVMIDACCNALKSPCVTGEDNFGEPGPEDDYTLNGCIGMLDTFNNFPDPFEDAGTCDDQGTSPEGSACLINDDCGVGGTCLPNVLCPSAFTGLGQKCADSTECREASHNKFQNQGPEVGECSSDGGTTSNGMFCLEDADCAGAVFECEDAGNTDCTKDGAADQTVCDGITGGGTCTEVTPAETCHDFGSQLRPWTDSGGGAPTVTTTEESGSGGQDDFCTRNPDHKKCK